MEHEHEAEPIPRPSGLEIKTLDNNGTDQRAQRGTWLPDELCPRQQHVRSVEHLFLFLQLCGFFLRQRTFSSNCTCILLLR